MRNSKQAIIFDYGGTLDTDGIHWSEKFWEAYLHFDITVPKEQFRNAFVYSEKIIPKIIQPAFSLKQTLRTQIEYQMLYLTQNNLLKKEDGIIERLSQYCLQEIKNNLPTTIAILETLKHEYALGLVSNYYGNVKTVLRELSLKKYFSSIIDSAVVDIRKPDLKIFQLSLNDLSVTAGKTIVVGDSYENDMVPGKSAGCTTIWIKGKSWKDYLQVECADSIINSIKELPDAIKTIERKQM